MTAPDQPAEAMTLARFNAADESQVREILLACCSSPRWAAALAQTRPFSSLEHLVDASDALFADLKVADVDDALAGHPRIGERAAGAGQDARFSAREQAAVTESDEQIQAQIRAGNVAYEQRFDRVFLIRAAGRSPEEILAELTRRLELDDEAEAAEVTEQLRQITRRRLQELITR